jgi:hypothetical protein
LVCPNKVTGASLNDTAFSTTGFALVNDTSKNIAQSTVPTATLNGFDARITTNTNDIAAISSNPFTTPVSVTINSSTNKCLTLTNTNVSTNKELSINNAGGETAYILNNGQINTNSSIFAGVNLNSTLDVNAGQDCYITRNTITKGVAPFIVKKYTGFTDDNVVPTISNDVNSLGVSYATYPIAYVSSILETSTSNALRFYCFYTNPNTTYYNLYYDFLNNSEVITFYICFIHNSFCSASSDAYPVCV